MSCVLCVGCRERFHRQEQDRGFQLLVSRRFEETARTSAQAGLFLCLACLFVSLVCCLIVLVLFYVVRLISFFQDIIFLDPPWGGPNYKDHKELQLNLGGVEMSQSPLFSFFLSFFLFSVALRFVASHPHPLFLLRPRLPLLSFCHLKSDPQLICVTNWFRGVAC
jgi:hypothetical protein